MARGLFHKAVVQSGAPLTSTLAAGAHLAEGLAARLGVADVPALRDVPVAALLRAQLEVEQEQPDRAFIPVVDGVAIPELPIKALGAGSVAGIPTLVGTNVDEWKLWAPGDPHSRDLDEARLRRRLERAFPIEAIDGVIDTVRAARDERGEGTAPNDVFYAVESDRAFRVHALRMAEAQGPHAPTFVYLFEWRSPALGGWLGACHGLEIAFVFGNQGRGELAAFTGDGPEADALAERMMDAWLAFARSGDPSTPALPWPTYDTTTRPTMVFGRSSRLEDAPSDAERAAIDAVLPRQSG